MKTNLDTIEEIVHMRLRETDQIMTLDELRALASEMRLKLQAFCTITDDEFEQLIKRLREYVEISIGASHTLRGEDSDHQSWYKTQKTDGFYWNRYREYLEKEKKWNREVVRQLNETTDKIMDDLGNPKSLKYFNRRGLLMGDVQSGKTATYTAICNKAADAGYQVIIVLAGMLDNLRFQTQERLDAEFSGRESKYALDKNADERIRNKVVGVGKFGKKDRNKRIFCFTTVVSDFNKKKLESSDFALRTINGTALFVVKKNKSILNNLHRWLLENNAEADGKINLSLLLIDDEADNASVNTQNEDHDPTAINLSIRNILHSFTQSSYLGITATPFANIFINPNLKENYAEDLFPRDFITVLPTPSNYIGTSQIFGTGNFDDGRARQDVKYPSALVRIDNDEMGDYFKFGHKKDLKHFLNDLPESLERAIRYFILATAVRDLRCDDKEHCSMLVNVTRFTEVQNRLAELIEEYVLDIKSAVEDYGRCKIEDAMQIQHIQDLKDVWDEYDLETLSNCDWESMLQDFLFESLDRIQIRAVNQSTGTSSLNYFNYKDTGMRVIAVGGNSLSRGLTLEGLCVSYFYRNTLMYDALLQMGRWFGYRPNYDDLFKIWMAEDAVDWYGFVADATNELKTDLIQMEKERKTPKEFGIRVRQNPNSLIITARNKMRCGTRIKVPITLSGRLIETPRLKNDVDVLNFNEKLCRNFMAELNQISGVSREINENPRALIWKNVPKKYISNFVGKYDTHPWNLNFQTKAISSYINNGCDDEYWDVAVPYGSVEGVMDDFVPGVSVIPEKRKVISDAKMLRISGTHVKVGSGNSTRIGLTKEEIERIEKQREEDNVGRKEKDKIPINDRTYLIKGRKPILMIHIIKAEYASETDKENLPAYLFALGIGFPNNGDDEKTVEYVVNPIELQEWCADMEDDDYDIW